MSNFPQHHNKIKQKVDALLSEMTVEEKAGQLTQYFVFSGASEQLEKVEAELRAGHCVRFNAFRVEIDTHSQKPY